VCEADTMVRHACGGHEYRDGSSRLARRGQQGEFGSQGRIGQRNAPTILNALYNKTQFWDGRVKTIEEQAALPIVNPSEMGQPSLDAAVAQIAAIGEYQQAFQGVFGSPPTGLDLVRASASSPGRRGPSATRRGPSARNRSSPRRPARDP
jgi:cytochrome c peroxidase